jgi:hypothetical protein
MTTTAAAGDDERFEPEDRLRRRLRRTLLALGFHPDQVRLTLRDGCRAYWLDLGHRPPGSGAPNAKET